MSGADLVLVVRRTIDAPAELLFDAWTRPEHLLEWWGPRPTRCIGAEMDLRVGGAYRLVHALPDGSTLVVSGEMLVVERPRKLVYTWRVGDAADAERVTVRFEPRGASTEIVVTHERIATEDARAGHEGGWNGCLDGLARLAARPSSSIG
jgi:uncharacterized protein YndB with AHSA1/START domain